MGATAVQTWGVALEYGGQNEDVIVKLDFYVVDIVKFLCLEDE